MILFTYVDLPIVWTSEMVSSVEWAQRNEIEDDYSLSTELMQPAAEAARRRRTFGESIQENWTTHPPTLSYTK